MIAVLDACVIYPPGLRDILLWQASVGAFEPRWTEEIHQEWMRNVLADRPDLAKEQLERTRRLMDEIDVNCLVVGYEARMEGLQLPDNDDRHVLAAAIEARASVIVTANLSDFPDAALRPFGIRPLSVDQFLTILYQEAPPRFLEGVKQHRASLRNPPKTAEEYLAWLVTQGLIRTASILGPHSGEL